MPVAPPERILELGHGCRIPLDELAVRTGPSGGPGGQHANRAHTRVSVTFDVAGSPSLPAAARARLLAVLGASVTATVDETRSQARNRDLAVERLHRKLADALRPPTPRRPTRPSRAAKERRLQAKRRQSERKAQRRGYPTD